MQSPYKILFILKIYTFVNYKVKVPDTVNLATVQDPVVLTVLVPGATAKPAGLHAVAILNIATPEDPSPALYSEPDV